MSENCATIIDLLIDQHRKNRMTQQELAKAANRTQGRYLLYLMIKNRSLQIMLA